MTDIQTPSPLNNPPIKSTSEKLQGEIRALKEEHDELERNLPAHGLKPAHLRRIEELEDLIQAKEDELARISR